MAETFKYHPVLKNVKVNNTGTVVKQHNLKCRIEEGFPKPNNPLMLVKINSCRISLPRLVLETYKGFPPIDGKYFARCVDGNYKNTHPDNLIWIRNTYTHQLKPKAKFKLATRLSKLSEAESFNCHTLFTTNKKTLTQLATDYNVSTTTIARAVKRVKAYLAELAKDQLIMI